MVNTPVQGGCADGIKAAMIALPSRLPAKASIISTVHDEIIVECDQSDAAEVSQILRTAMREEMEGIFPTVPIEVEVGVCRTWGEKP
jgi:DNA polymerase-1